MRSRITNETPWAPLVALAFGASALLGCEQGMTVQISQSTVQAQVAERFPITRDLGMGKLTMSDPKIDLKAGQDRVGLTTDLEFGGPGGVLNVKGSARASGALRYDQDDATFYMSDPVVQEVELPAKLMSEARKKKLMDLTGKAIGEAYGDVPLYTLRDSRRDRTAKLLLREVRVREGKLELVLGMPE